MLLPECVEFHRFIRLFPSPEAHAANIRRSRSRPGSVWHLDEMVVRINGRAENSHISVRGRERKMQRFKSYGLASASFRPTAPP